MRSGRGGTGGEVTGILGQMRAGDRDAAARLLPLVYDELRAIARGHLARDRPGHTLPSSTVSTKSSAIEGLTRGQACRTLRG